MCFSKLYEFLVVIYLISLSDPHFSKTYADAFKSTIPARDKTPFPFPKTPPKNFLNRD
jgi:hypothetical protein